MRPLQYPYTNIAMKKQLTGTYGHRWIGNRGSVRWPPRSPDLNPMDFLIWGHLKQLVYRAVLQHENDLKEIIHDALNVVNNT